MLRLKIPLLLATLFLWHFAVEIHAQVPTTTATNSAAVRTELRSGETVGTEQVKRAYVTYGTNLYVFRLPPGFSFDASNPEKILLSNSKEGRFISIEWVKSTQSESSGFGPDQSRVLVFRHFPGAKIDRQFCEFALNRSGPAFDVQWTASGFQQSACVVFIPLATGFLEITMVANSDKFAACQTELEIVLASLQSDEAGKIDIQPLPDYS